MGRKMSFFEVSFDEFRDLLLAQIIKLPKNFLPLFALKIPQQKPEIHHNKSQHITNDSNQHPTIHIIDNNLQLTSINFI